MEKLECYGVQDKELEWFKNYLFDRHIRVCFDGVLSEKRSVFTGVPQGSNLGPLLFVIFFNDITENLIHSKIVIYADNTVIFCETKKLDEIEICLNADLQNLHSWFKENELLLNLKPGKTEVLSFGTSKRLSMLQREIEIKIMNQPINVTNSYKYLGVEIDHSLDLNSHFERTMTTKMTTRLRLLNRMRTFLTTEAALTAVTMLIVPLFTYCCLLKPVFNQMQTNRIKSFERRTQEIIAAGEPLNCNVNLLDCGKHRVCEFVQDVLLGNVKPPLNDYFTVANTKANTRYKNLFMHVPKVKLGYGKRSIRFMGAKIFNDLPINIRKKYKDTNFKDRLKKHNF